MQTVALDYSYPVQIPLAKLKMAENISPIVAIGVGLGGLCGGIYATAAFPMFLIISTGVGAIAGALAGLFASGPVAVGAMIGIRLSRSSVRSAVTSAQWGAALVMLTLVGLVCLLTWGAAVIVLVGASVPAAFAAAYAGQCLLQMSVAPAQAARIKAGEFGHQLTMYEVMLAALFSPIVFWLCAAIGFMNTSH